MTKATKQNNEKSMQVKFLEILQDARKLQEKEQLPIVNRLYKATVDKENLTVKLEIEVPLTDVVRSAKGSNYVVPIANEKGARGSGVANFVSDDGLNLKLYADRVYVSTQAQEDDKKLKALSRNDSEKQLLKESLAETKAQNAMLLQILKDKGLLD
jgi:hypothetical protein